MEDFIQEFITESKGILQHLQESLMLLEEDRGNESLIEEIFRGLHTLKGSARMFGFEKIEGITHELENTYDQVREGDLTVSRALIDLSLKVVDMVGDILDDNCDETNYDALCQQLNSGAVSVTEAHAQPKGVFQILYHPHENIYARGVNPMAIFDELKDLGQYEVIELTKSADQSTTGNGRSFHSKYEIILGLEQSYVDLEDVFLFMEQDEFSIHPVESDDDEILNACSGRAKEIATKRITKKIDEERLNAYKSLLTTFQVTSSTPVAYGSPAKIKGTGDMETEKRPGKAEDISLSYLNVKLSRLDEMMNLVSELVTVKAKLAYLAATSEDAGLLNSVEHLDKITTRFRDNAFSMRLVPLQILSMKFQRMVRDFEGRLDKKINLITEGLDTEIDKSIINEVEAPLMHIIRNAIDHGLETPEERMAIGKPEKGLLKILAFYAGTNVFIQVQDDGKGLDIKKIRNKAVEKGIIKEKANLSEQEIINLIFAPGFSTHDNATEYSGRGVGMDVVQNKIKELRGSIEITTEKGLGTAFTLRLPLSLSILEVLHIRVGSINYLLPHSEIEQCLSERLNVDDIKKEGYNLKYQGDLIPHLVLSEILGEPADQHGEPSIIILNKNDQHIAIEVDEIIGEAQLVIKPVDEALKSISYLSGVSVLGNGELAFLLDCIRLKESFAQQSNEKTQYTR